MTRNILAYLHEFDQTKQQWLKINNIDKEDAVYSGDKIFQIMF